MKKKCKLFMSFLLFLFLVSCLPEIKPPFGVWENSELDMVLFIEPAYQTPLVNRLHTYMGLFTENNDEIKTFVIMSNGGKGFSIYEAVSTLEAGIAYLDAELILAGTFKLKKDKMHYTLSPSFKESIGYDVITFHKLENYESPNPEDWLLKK